ncbi:MAG: response regulator [Vicinamibacterales bacterium]|nr:response regulator [Vicinamibacterales bacterium]
MLVEDNQAAREGLSQLLGLSGFSVTTANDGVEALEKLNEQSFDVMLLDIWLPRMNGLQLFEQLRDKPNQPKVIVMTADDSPETLLLTLRQQAYQFVSKPVQPAALVELLRNTLAAPTGLPAMVVLSARPGWVEVLVPCARDVADRIQSYILQLELDLPQAVRETVGMVFRELLLDAMEWDGHLDPNRKVRIAFLRARRMLLYRIADAGSGFRVSDSPVGAAGRQADTSVETTGHRGGDMGLRPGAIMARAQADEVLFNEARNEVVVVKYLD